MELLKSSGRVLRSRPCGVLLSPAPQLLTAMRPLPSAAWHARLPSISCAHTSAAGLHSVSELVRGDVLQDELVGAVPQHQRTAAGSALASLNAEQLSIVESTGSTRVMACPGSGKTRVLVGKALSLISNGALPGSIMLITFTKKAARELGERIDRVMGEEAAKRMAIGNFHQIGCRILMQFADRFQLSILSTRRKRYSIHDPDDVLTTIKATIVDHDIDLSGLGGDSKKLTPDDAAMIVDDLISAAAATLPCYFSTLQAVERELAPTIPGDIPLLRTRCYEEVLRQATAASNRHTGLATLLPADELARLTNAGAKVYKEEHGGLLLPLETVAVIWGLVDEYRAFHNITAFDDMVCLATALLEVPAVAKSLQGRFRHIMVDEMQDTNGPQYRMIQLLAGITPGVALTVVGDQNQAIYGFRLADSDYMEHLVTEDFPDVGTKQLVRNYRSRPEILAVASAVLGEAGEPMTAVKGKGRPVTYSQHANKEKEMDALVARIRDRHNRGVPYRHVAVLFRTRSEGDAVEKALLEANIPLTRACTSDFFTTGIVKEVLSYLKIIMGSNDKLPLLRVVNEPPRGIGPLALATSTDFAEAHDTTLIAMLQASIAGRIFTPPQLEEIEAECWLHESEVAVQGGDGKAPPSPTLVALGAELCKADPMALADGTLKLRAPARQGWDNLRHILIAIQTAIQLWPPERVIKFTALITGLHRRAVQGKAPPERDHAADHRDRKIGILAAAAQKAAEQAMVAPILEDNPRPKAGAAAGVEAMEAFLYFVAMMDEPDAELEGDMDGRVHLCTMHQSKGLEFKHVMAVGWQDGTVPHIQHAKRHLEITPRQEREERNLAFVAVTRAEEECHVSWSCSASFLDPKCSMSRFLTTLPDALAAAEAEKSESAAGSPAPSPVQAPAGAKRARRRPPRNKNLDIRMTVGGGSVSEGGVESKPRGGPSGGQYRAKSELLKHPPPKFTPR